METYSRVCKCNSLSRFSYLCSIYVFLRYIFTYWVLKVTLSMKYFMHHNVHVWSPLKHYCLGLLPCPKDGLIDTINCDSIDLKSEK
jgi:hypothetical protein